jgi:hypothetical protein
MPAEVVVAGNKEPVVDESIRQLQRKAEMLPPQTASSWSVLNARIACAFLRRNPCLGLSVAAQAQKRETPRYRRIFVKGL